MPALEALVMPAPAYCARPPIRRLTGLCTGLASLAAVALGVGVPSSFAQTFTGRVARIVDGDTIHVIARGFDTTVRLVGIDTPETHPVRCFGPEASARTARMLAPGTAVRLETDPTQLMRDRYGRLLAYVYRRAGTGGSGATGSVNFALVASGFAKVYVYGSRPFRYVGTFERAQARARARRLGLWGPPCRGQYRRPRRVDAAT
jgi:micrococcal nuclease